MAKVKEREAARSAPRVKQEDLPRMRNCDESVEPLATGKLGETNAQVDVRGSARKQFLESAPCLEAVRVGGEDRAETVLNAAVESADGKGDGYLKDAPILADAEAPDESNASSVISETLVPSSAPALTSASSSPDHIVPETRVAHQVWLLKKCAEERLGFEIREGLSLTSTNSSGAPGHDNIEVQVKAVCSPALQHCLKVRSGTRLIYSK